jgi:hypothetical protein
MRKIDSYEQFCKAFESEDEIKKKANLLLFIQNWIIRILEHIEEDNLDYSLKKMIEQNADKILNEHYLKDALSRIVDNSNLAFRHLNENMRTKIIRENIQMPVYKVREINSYGLNWLSRQSGKTIRQKISSAGNSLMAVQRRMSLDTAENRLFIDFAKEIYDKLNTKLETLKKFDQRQIISEEDMRDELSIFLRRDDIKEVRRWENLPPNNTLLSDQNYKKIWYAWNEMKKIDEHIKNDLDLIENRLVIIFFVELLVYFRKILQIPQIPVEVDYDNYNVYLCDKELYCLDDEENSIIIGKDNNRIYLKSLNKNINVDFFGTKVFIRVSNEEDKEYEITKDKIYTYIKYIASKLGIGISKMKSIEIKKEKQKFKNVVVDLFSLHPEYIGDDVLYEKLTERILQQKYTADDIDGDEKNYYIPCDDSNAIKMISGVTTTYTIPFAVDNGMTEEMKRLVHMLGNYILTDSLTYLFPDVYNELQLSMVHKATRMVYRKVRNVPLSIGAAFKFQTMDIFREKFEAGEFLLVVNLIDDEVTFTLVAGEYDEKLNLEINGYKGIIWERHPTSTALFKEKIDNNIIDSLTKIGCIKSEKIYKLLGLEGLYDEINNLSIFFGNNWFKIAQEVKEIVERFKLDITESVTEFLNRNSSILNNANVHIISLVDNLTYKGKRPFYKFSKKDVLEGCKELERLEKLTEISLWHDHLPALAIKLMYGKFDLIKKNDRNARVRPKFEEKKNIPIILTFTLPKKCKEYHFNLVQDENTRKMQYEAVIKNPAFPLNNDVECNLIMSYQYGAEDPYELIFVPKDSKTAGFLEAKVNWKRLESYSIEELKVPDFPEKIPWSDLQHYSGRKGDIINVFDVLENQFKLLNEGYYTFDISGTFMRKDKDGKCGEFTFEKDGEDVRVQWSQRDWDKESTPPQNISKISCWIVPNVSEKKKRKRYRISNLWEARTRGDKLWFVNKNEGYQCIVNFDYDGDMKTIAIIDSKFDMPERFHTGINDITFEVNELPNGNLQAVNIHNEDEELKGPLKRFNAINICEGDKIPVPPRFFINAYYGKWIRTLFANNRSLSEEECPTDFQIIFARSVDNWINLFYQYRNPKDKKELFTLLSLVAKDIGKDYYDLAYKVLDMYGKKELDIPYEIGCAFCDLSNDMQRELMNFTLNEVVEDYEAIGILAKAIWHNEQFVYNVDLDLLLNNYLPKSIDYIGKALHHLRKKRVAYENLENIKYCLEFILGVMRLRDLNDPMITNNYLSLNNLKIQELYKYIEIMVDNNTKIYSFLKLEITSKGIYEKISDLLYVLLVYITGNNIEGEIRISLNMDD